MTLPIRLDDTIAAVATPPGEGGVGVVRVSGPRAHEIAGRLFTRGRQTTDDGRRTQDILAPGPEPRALSPEPSASIQNPIPLSYGRIIDPATNETVDDALLLRFRAPHSYTGEDVVEFSCHGGPVTLARVLRLCLEAGARHAEPGEFTQRAFLNGRMDLAQAEAVCDLIRARTETQQRLAVRQREGGLSRRVASLRDELVGALAAVEVTIDFSDEVGDLDYGELHVRLERLADKLEELRRSGERGRVFREGVRLAIVGRPNAGKSSLMNALLKEERAIVTPVAGTTRDTIEETANIRGIPITAIDTAGLRETEDLVEQIGVERARAAIETASLMLVVVDAEQGWSAEEARVFEAARGRPALGALNKSDVVSADRLEALLSELPGRAPIPWMPVSCLTGEGIGALEEAIAAAVLGGEVEPESLVLTNSRHLHALSQAEASVRLATETTAGRLAPDFISIDLRGALNSLGRITGETATDEVIHRIFHDFCVGK